MKNSPFWYMVFIKLDSLEAIPYCFYLHTYWAPNDAGIIGPGLLFNDVEAYEIEGDY